MKKRYLALILTFCMVCAVLTGCQKKPEEQTAPVTPEASEVSSEPVEDVSAEPESQPEELEAPVVNTDGAYVMLDVADVQEEPYQFVVEESGTYTFTAHNAEGYEALEWMVQVGDSQTLTVNGTEETVCEIVSDESVTCVCEGQPAGASTLLVRFQPAETVIEAVGSPLAFVDAADVYGDGCYSFQAEQDGTVTVSNTVQEDFDFSSIEYEYEPGQPLWSFYVMDEEFVDAPRYLHQASESVLEGDGSFEVKSGQYVYCCCTINGFTANEIPPEVCVLSLTVE